MLVFDALKFATEAHRPQQRKYTGEGYIVHPLAVAKLVESVTSDQGMIAAALLHDVVEDTPVTISIVQDKFGTRVASLVEALTDVSRPEDGNRAIRKALDRDHLAQASPDAKTIKLADLIHNTKSIVRYDPDFARIYMFEKRQLLEVLKEGHIDLYVRAQKMVDTYFEKEEGGEGLMNMPTMSSSSRNSLQSIARTSYIPLDEMENYIRLRRIEHGVAGKVVAKKVRVSLSQYYSLELGYIPPLTRTGTIKPWVQDICDLLGTSFEEAFPREICELYRGEILDTQLPEILGPDQNFTPDELYEQKETISNAWKALLEFGGGQIHRHRKLFFRHILGNDTLVDIAHEENLTIERLRQVLARMKRALILRRASFAGEKYQ